jgi:hypothetical protein
MKYLQKNILISAFLFLTSFHVIGQATSSLKEDLKLMAALMKGEFDNFQQITQEIDTKVKNKHNRVHTVFAPIQAPSIGQNVFYVKQYFDDNANQFFQWIYVLNEDATEKAIRLDKYNFKVDTTYINVYLKPDKIKTLSMDKLENKKGCSIYWKRNGEVFVGHMKEKACELVSKSDNKKFYLKDSLILSRNEFWFREQGIDETGKMLYGHVDKVHHKLKRCEVYVGWWRLKKEGTEDKFDLNRQVYLHDQGGRLRLIDAEKKPTKYTVELSKVIFGKDLEVLKLALYEDGKNEALDFAWTSSNAGMIGMNVKWFQSSFSKLPPPTSTNTK